MASSISSNTNIATVNWSTEDWAYVHHKLVLEISYAGYGVVPAIIVRREKRKILGLSAKCDAATIGTAVMAYDFQTTSEKVLALKPVEDTLEVPSRH